MCIYTHTHTHTTWSKWDGKLAVVNLGKWYSIRMHVLCIILILIIFLKVWNKFQVKLKIILKFSEKSICSRHQHDSHHQWVIHPIPEAGYTRYQKGMTGRRQGWGLTWRESMGTERRQMYSFTTNNIIYLIKNLQIMKSGQSLHAYYKGFFSAIVNQFRQQEQNNVVLAIILYGWLKLW